VSGKATTIAAARQELAKGNFDAVLLDIGLDGHSSAEVADVLLDMAVPIAFVTGNDGSHLGERSAHNCCVLAIPFERYSQARIAFLSGMRRRD
jgi:DNA-binding LytR/AlgR family response regulator